MGTIHQQMPSNLMNVKRLALRARTFVGQPHSQPHCWAFNSAVHTFAVPYPQLYVPFGCQGPDSYVDARSHACHIGHGTGLTMTFFSGTGSFLNARAPNILVAMVAPMLKAVCGPACSAIDPKLSSQKVTDGLSNTLAMGEAHGGVLASSGDAPASWLWMSAPTLPASGSWMPGTNERSAFSSYHTGIIQFVLGDGSVRAISRTIDVSSWISINGMKDAEIVSDFKSSVGSSFAPGNSAIFGKSVILCWNQYLCFAKYN